MHEQVKNEKEKGKWILVIGCNCLVFEMGSGAFSGQVDLNANVHAFCFTLTLNLPRIATAHWSGLGRLFLIFPLSLSLG